MSKNLFEMFPIVIDPSVPENEILVKQGGQIIGRIVNTSPAPSDESVILHVAYSFLRDAESKSENIHKMSPKSDN